MVWIIGLAELNVVLVTLKIVLVTLKTVLVTLKIVLVLLKIVLVTLNNAQASWVDPYFLIKSITLANGSNSSDRNAVARHYNTLLHAGTEQLEPLYNDHNQPIPQFPLTMDSIKTMNGMCGYKNDV